MGLLSWFRAFYGWVLSFARFIWRLGTNLQEAAVSSGTTVVELKAEIVVCFLLFGLGVPVAQYQDTWMNGVDAAYTCFMFPLEQIVNNLIGQSLVWALDNVMVMWNDLFYYFRGIAVDLINDIVSISNLFSVQGVTDIVTYVVEAINNALLFMEFVPSVQIAYVWTYFVQFMQFITGMLTLITRIATDVVNGYTVSESETFCEFYKEIKEGNKTFGLDPNPNAYCTFMENALWGNVPSCDPSQTHFYELSFFNTLAIFFNLITADYLVELIDNIAIIMADLDRFIKRIIFIIMGIIDTGVTHGNPGTCVTTEDLAAELLLMINDFLVSLDQVLCLFDEQQANDPNNTVCNVLVTAYDFIVNSIFVAVHGIEGMVTCMQNTTVSDCFNSYPVGNGNGYCEAWNLRSEGYSELSFCNVSGPSGCPHNKCPAANDGICCCTLEGYCQGLYRCTVVLDQCLSQYQFFQGDGWDFIFKLSQFVMEGVDTLVCPFEIIIEAAVNAPDLGIACSLDLGSCNCNIAGPASAAMVVINNIACGLPLIAPLMNFVMIIAGGFQTLLQSVGSTITFICWGITCLSNASTLSCITTCLSKFGAITQCAVEESNLPIELRRAQEMDQWTTYLQSMNISNATFCGQELYGTTPLDADLSGFNFYHYCLTTMQIMNYHIQEHPENFSDINALHQLHTLPSTIGTLLDLGRKGPPPDMPIPDNMFGGPRNRPTSHSSKQTLGWGDFISQSANSTASYFDRNRPDERIRTPKEVFPNGVHGFQDTVYHTLYFFYYQFRTSNFYNNTREMVLTMKDIRRKYGDYDFEKIGMPDRLPTEEERKHNATARLQYEVLWEWNRFRNQWAYDYAHVPYIAKRRNLVNLPEPPDFVKDKDATMLDVFARGRHARELKENITSYYQSVKSNLTNYVQTTNRVVSGAVTRLGLDSFPLVQGMGAFWNAFTTGNWEDFNKWYKGKQGYSLMEGYVNVSRYEELMSDHSVTLATMDQVLGVYHWPRVQAFHATYVALKESRWLEFKAWKRNELGYLVEEGFVSKARYEEKMKEHEERMEGKAIYKILYDNETILAKWYDARVPVVLGPFTLPWTISSLSPNAQAMYYRWNSTFASREQAMTQKMERRRQKQSSTFDFDTIVLNIFDFFVWLFLGIESFFVGAYTTLKTGSATSGLVNNFTATMQDWAANTFDCHYPYDIGNSTHPYNPFCIPLLPETFFANLIPTVPINGSVFWNTQLGWPQGFYDPNVPQCANVYNGNPEPLHFKFSDTCPAGSKHGTPTQPLCPFCDYCVNEYLTCFELDWFDGLDNLLYLVAIVGRVFDNYFHDAGVEIATLEPYVVVILFVTAAIKYGAIAAVISIPVVLLVLWLLFTIWGGVIPYGLIVVGATIVSLIHNPETLTSNLIIFFALLFLDLGWAISQFFVVPSLYFNPNIWFLDAFQWLQNFPLTGWINYGALISRFQHFAYVQSQDVPPVDQWCFFIRFGNVGLLGLEVIGLYVLGAFVVAVISVTILLMGETGETTLTLVGDSRSERNVNHLGQRHEDLDMRVRETSGFLASHLLSMMDRMDHLERPVVSTDLSDQHLHRRTRSQREEEEMIGQSLSMLRLMTEEGNQAKAQRQEQAQLRKMWFWQRAVRQIFKQKKQ